MPSSVAGLVARDQAAAVTAAQQAARGEQANTATEAEAAGDASTDPNPTDVAGIVAATAMEEPEEEEEEERAAAAMEQAVAASVVDTLALVDLKECTACTPVCGERFSHLNMTTKAKGYKNQWVCMDREACLQRQLSGAGARGDRRTAKAPRRQ